MSSTALVHLGAGIGNIVLATPLLVALNELDFQVDVMLAADYPECADLLRDWSMVRTVRNRCDQAALTQYDVLVPALPPFYWSRFQSLYARAMHSVARPPDALFYRDEQEFYLSFARRLGYAASARPLPRLPYGESQHAITALTLVLAPGCKTGEMATKRWPWFAQLAERFDDVAVVGTADDLRTADRTIAFAAHVRNLVGRLSLADTRDVLAAAGCVVANDSGLAHIAAAVGTPVVMLFGPTPHETLGSLPQNVVVLRAGLPCEPCWFGARFAACAQRIDCLRQLDVERVEAAVRGLLGPPAHAELRGSDSAPLVSCVMPTRNRRDFVPAAIAFFLAQDYDPRELVVLDDGDDPVADLMPPDPRVRYVRLNTRLRVGAKRNLGAELARGSLIAHWDDDDWMASWRLSYQVNALRTDPKAQLCGLDRLLFYDRRSGQAWEYAYPPNARSWVAGGSLCYRKAFWSRRRFRDIDEGEDTRFVFECDPGVIRCLADHRFYVAAVHDGNTSRKRMSGARWRRLATAELEALIGVPIARALAAEATV